ncbi:ATP synthase F1 subunit gamma [Clostridium isatidis]|uniref:ATP synthase gamma chain n=1 Tax=Clostridium isatidis TaxID=182773 RepID=A0A343JEU8_9CLOT|nr:ATP synthase F1 subunit gamma [Clostridium isatidis]ASW44056.1 ATP synthase F1 subunit gamma [Clostridium isatidis]
MGAAGLIEIKRRMKSVESTRKITKAMNIVATSKLRKVRNELNKNEDYYNLSKEILKKVVALLPEEYESPFLNNLSKDLIDSKLYIVITSDTGFCGGFNSNIINTLNDSIEDKDSAKFIVAGLRGIQYMKKFGLTTIREYIEIPDIPTTKEVRAIYDDALFMYKNKEVSEVNIVYTEYRSAISQEIIIERIFPVDIEKEDPEEIIFEPDLEKVLSSSLDSYLKSKIRRAMLHSKASEQNARMKTMDSSTDNANDILKALTTNYNRIRQGMITQEISEIVGGAEALK